MKSRKLQHGRTPADALSYTWSYHLPHSLPTYGPHRVHRTIGEDERKAGILQLVETMRELCLYYLKHIDRAHVESCPVDVHNERLIQLGRHFYFKDSQSVCQFLSLHRSLFPVLFEARKKIEENFGAEILTNLKLFTDPEDEPSEPTLFVLILTSLPAKDAMVRLTRLDNEWWIDQSSDIQRLMSIDVEYVNGRV